MGSIIRTPISITLLVKNPKSTNKKASIHYHDIGDYLSREEKLGIINNFKSITNAKLKWKSLKPNEYGDWLNQRNDLFGDFIPIADKSKSEPSFFALNSNGIVTNRDSWVYNSSESALSGNMKGMISYYNSEVDRFIAAKGNTPDIDAKDFVSTDPKRIKWVQNLYRDAQNGLKLSFVEDEIVVSFYRPYFKQKLYKHRNFVWSPYLQPSIFPDSNTENLVICTTGVGSSKDFSALMSEVMPNLDGLEKLQAFPLYYFEERQKKNPSLFDASGDSAYIRRDGVTDFILERAHKQYGKNVSKEDVFYYVYGILHSPDYRIAFANDLKKMLPRIPLVEDVRDFWKFSKAGRALADLHIKYEEVPPYEGVEVTGADSGFYKVEKMRFPKKNQKDSIIFNSKIVVSNIPAKAYEYVVNGKSAIEWIMERYAVTTHKDSGIKNDPNDWSEETGKPTYILDLLLSIINVSVQTVDIVNSLPKLEFEK